MIKTAAVLDKEYRILVRETSGAKPKRLYGCEKCVYNSGKHTCDKKNK